MRSPWLRSSAAPKAWKVPSHGRSGPRGPAQGKERSTRSPTEGAPPPDSAFTTRSRISPAARLVNVIPRMLRGGTPSWIRRRMRATMARVLPEPAPATRRSGPPSWRTAWRWSGSSVVKMGSDNVMGTAWILLEEVL